MSQILHAKVAVVTGGSKGIGAAIARDLALNGAYVVVNYASSKAGADAVVADIESHGGKAVAVQGDVSLAADAQRVVEAAVATYGRLDILVNNAGIYEFNPLEAITEEHFHRTFNINVLSPILMIQAALNTSQPVAQSLTLAPISPAWHRRRPQCTPPAKKPQRALPWCWLKSWAQDKSE